MTEVVQVVSNLGAVRDAAALNVGDAYSIGTGAADDVYSVVKDSQGDLVAVHVNVDQIVNLPGTGAQVFVYTNPRYNVNP